ncbi:ATP-binding cassette domain-containing protein [Tistrella mobilis]|uniref:ATP-binding cassette domain-containing protein n=1 Tax=Tistrella mobilis TaxID=171437 RepID=UPI0035591C6C
MTAAGLMSDSRDSRPATRPSGPPLVEIRNLLVERDGRRLLDGIDLAIAPGRIVTLIGPNGAGKSTLVKAALGLVAPSAGTVVRRPGLRIGYVPQSLAVDRTLPLTARRFMTLADVHGRRPRASEIAEALAEAGAEGLETRSFHKLSGGEAKRVMLARALLQQPDLLVLDEAAAHLDMPGQIAFYRTLRAIRDRRGCGILMVSHDLHLVMSATDHVLCLNGHVCCSGHPDDVSRDPAFLALFGPLGADALAPYHHAHDHVHDHVHGPGGCTAGCGPDDVPHDHAAAGHHHHH